MMYIPCRNDNLAFHQFHHLLEIKLSISLTRLNLCFAIATAPKCHMVIVRLSRESVRDTPAPPCHNLITLPSDVGRRATLWARCRSPKLRQISYLALFPMHRCSLYKILSLSSLRKDVILYQIKMFRSTVKEISQLAYSNYLFYY